MNLGEKQRVVVVEGEEAGEICGDVVHFLSLVGSFSAPSDFLLPIVGCLLFK